MPPLSRMHYRRELAVWSLLPIALGAVEGGVTGVIAKNVFDDVVSERWLNIAVALLTTAPAFANILSFIWAALSHGRDKIRFVTFMQRLTMGFVALVAFAPDSGFGVVVLLVGAIGARFCWSGVITLRSTIWAANFPRHARANMAGKLATVQALTMAAVALLIGTAMDYNDQAFRVLYPIAAVIGLIGVRLYAKMRMRGHRAMLNRERDGDDTKRSLINPMQMLVILREDVRFRRYMICMFVFGSGNLMVLAPLIIHLKEVFGEQKTLQMVIAQTIPLIMMPICLPYWGRLLDRVHIIEFRAVHCWAFVSFIAAVFIASITGAWWLFFPAAVVKGAAMAGGVLGWNLGHHDFAPVEKASQYMGVHVSLTGIRGVFAPLVGVGIYELLRESPYPEALTFVVCGSLSLAGAFGFMWMAHRYRREEALAPGA